MSMVDLGRFNQDGVGIPPFAIKSIQQKRVTSNALTVDTTIDSVVVANTLVIMQVVGWKTGSFSQDISDCYLTSPTNLRVSGGLTTVHLQVTIIEFEPSAIKSLQTGTSSVGSVSGSPIDITISSVTPAKSFAIINGLNYGETGGDGYSQSGSGVVTTATNLQVTEGQATGDCDFRWYVVEFY